MATIKAGTYRFNDALTAPPDNMWREYINFTVNSTVAGAEIVSSCEAISFGRDVDLFGVNYDVVNDDGSNTPTEVYSNAVTEYHSKGWYTSYLGFKSKETLMTYGGITDEQASAFATSYGEGVKTITIPNDTEVSAEFAEWFTANAVQQKQISSKWRFNVYLTPISGLQESVNFTAKYSFEYQGTHSGTVFCSGLSFIEGDGYAFRVRSMLNGLSDPTDQMIAESVVGVSFPFESAIYTEYNNGETGFNFSVYGFDFQTIDFGTEPQTVSAEFYSWLTANATQPTASVSHNGEEIASLFPGQTATLKCAGMKMAGDVVVSVADNVGGGVCDKSHIIEVDKLPETGEDGAIYSTPELSAVALCVDGVVSADFAEESGMDAKYYTFASLPETGEQGDICYVESENELYMYIDAWYPLNMLLAAYGYSVRMKGAIKDANEIAEDGYYAVMGSKSLNLCTNGRYKTLITKGEVVYFSRNEGRCSVESIEPYYDSDIIVPSVSSDGLIVESVTADAFAACTSLVSIVLPDSIESIGNSAFSGCYGLRSVTLGNGLKHIGSSAFGRCYSLKEVTIPDSVELINDGAFANCYALETVTIGSGVRTIGMNVFKGCSNLNYVYFNGTKIQWAAISKDGSWCSGIPATVVVCTDGNVTL